MICLGSSRDCQSYIGTMTSFRLTMSLISPCHDISCGSVAFAHVHQPSRRIFKYFRISQQWLHFPLDHSATFVLASCRGGPAGRSISSEAAHYAVVANGAVLIYSGMSSCHSLNWVAKNCVHMRQRLLMTNDKARSAFKIRLTPYRRRKTWSQMWQQLKEISKAESINTWSAAKFVCLPQADKDKSKFLFIDYEDLKSKRYDGLWKD